jgi:LmbE family N-acetylglucosaminyl deacetylase
MLMSDLRAALGRLPLTGDILHGRRALILSPHPDDESLGAGGLIAKAAAAGERPVLVWLTDGAASHPGSRQFAPPALSRLRETEALEAAAALGVAAADTAFLRQPDTAMPVSGPAFEAALETLVALTEARGCGVILAAWEHDPHGDHQAGAVLARALAARTGLDLIFYPVWGLLRADTDELPLTSLTGWRLDIAAQLPAKRAAIAAHRSQAGPVVTDVAGFALPRALLEACLAPSELYFTA